MIYCLFIAIDHAYAAQSEKSWRRDLDAAMAYARENNFNYALPVFERLHKEHPDDLDVTRYYLAALDWNKQTKASSLLYQALPDDNEPDYVLAAAGDAFRAEHNNDKAIEIYAKAHKLYPDQASFAEADARLLEEGGHYAEAMQVAQNWPATADKSVEQDEKALLEKIQYDYAVSEARQGRYNEAIPLLEKLHAQNPGDIRIMRDLTAVYGWANKDQKAFDIYQTLPQGQQPDYVYAAVGKSLRNLHRFADALALYQEAATLYPDHTDFTQDIALTNNDINPPKVSEVIVVRPVAHVLSPQEIEAKQVDAAAKFAREGSYDAALKMLATVLHENPSNTTAVHDQIAVFSWASRDVEASHAYEIAKLPSPPDYVLAAVGHSYRNLRQTDKALKIYQAGYRQSPRNEAFAVGVIAIMLDRNQFPAAYAFGQHDLVAHGNRRNVLVMTAIAAEGDNKIYEALSLVHRALVIDPKSRETLQVLVRLEMRMGAPHVALETARHNNLPLEPSQTNQAEGDIDAAMVHWGRLEPASDRERYKETDEAITMIDTHISQWIAAKGDHSADILRARFDRILALRDRTRMQDVVQSYEQLQSQSIAIPNYVLGSVGEAYLYLRHPEKARDIFLRALVEQPKDFSLRRQLFYAYVECDQFDEAFATVDALRDDQPVWRYLKGDPERQPNHQRAEADIDAANARLYAGDTDGAEVMLAPIIHASPNNPDVRGAAGNLLLARAQPRAALDQYRLGMRVSEDRSSTNEAGAAEAALDMRDYANANAQAKILSQDYPESLDVQHLARQVEIYKKAEYDASSYYNMKPSGSVTGGEGYGGSADYYSQPILYNWRIFAGTSYAHEVEPNNEGAIGFTQVRAGAEYRDVSFVGSLAPTYNHFHNDERVGAMGSGEWTFDDQWNVGSRVDLFSADVPLRALNSGVTSNKYAADAQYIWNEVQHLRFDTYLMPFSDNNLRSAGNLFYTERVYTLPHWRFDAVASGSASHNTGNENRNYYNPSTDFLGSVGPKVTQILYRRYETQYEHSLQIMPGGYWEQGHGLSPAWAIGYELALQQSDTLSGKAGVNYGHQSYDGTPQNSVNLTVGLAGRF